MKKIAMSMLPLLVGLPASVLLALVGCVFALLLVLLFLVVFVPTATDRIVRVISVLQRQNKVEGTTSGGVERKRTSDDDEE
ncbi:MAG: hypothetical protein ACREDR_00030 [Blastocatellia bacterium]